MYEKTSNPYKFKYLITGITGPGIPCVYLPPEPPDEEVLFKEQQMFVRTVPPDYLKEWMDEFEVETERTKKKQEKYPEQNIPDYIHPHQAELNEWEERETDRCENGIWFWNDGVKTYITGAHYKYLTQWDAMFGYPDYWETDKEIWYWVKFWEEDPRSYGGILNTSRRTGKSTKLGFWITNRTSTNFKHIAGMQGQDNKKIKDFYDKMCLAPFYKLPYYSKPIYDTNSLQKNEIVFNEPPRRNRRAIKSKKKLVLESSMDYRTSEVDKYDSAKLHSSVNEEPGKCHPKGTLIRMFDGSVKKVEDVQIGDQLRGDDNEPRVVVNTGNGFGAIYKIKPNSKAEPWYVNEDHILSCKVSSNHLFRGLKKGDVLNISVKDYLSANKSFKKHLMCYRVGAEYPHRHHNIDPYFLGLWLGDGSSNTLEITNEEPEIVDWLCEYCKKMGFVFKTKKCINRAQTYSINNGKHGLKNIFRQKHLLNNKHIPKDYLIDSRENRLKLLAGIIDTDGSRDKREGARSYEITQKRKNLAEDIKELCLSLGFSAAINSKIATMKRKDGSVYKCLVYRVTIFGRNLHEIPCLVSRKKMPPLGSIWNVKDPSVYGFTVEYDREDCYYGFNITGNRLYLLADYTVTHNTLTCDISERWDFMKPCHEVGIEIVGKSFWGTTVEFMDTSGKGGKAYQKICMRSDYDIRNAVGQTISGLYAALMPGDCVLQGCIDKHGRPEREKARKYILARREAVKNNPKDYSTLVRKHALNWNEVFYITADKCEFNVTILQDRKAELMLNPPSLRRVSLAWQDNKPFTKVVMRDDPSNGWLKLAWLPDDKELQLLNNVGVRMESGTQKYFPKNADVFSSGTDPIDYGVKVDNMSGEDVSDTRRSRPVLSVKRKYDIRIDGPLDQLIMEKRRDEKYPYKTNRRIASMDHRPNEPNVYFERALMACWLFGMPMMCESQKPGIINYFRDRGCEDFLLNKYVPSNTYRPSDLVDGTPASTMMNQELTGLLATHIEYFGHTEPFIEYVEDYLLFDPTDTKKFDYAMAAGWNEVAEKVKPKQQAVPQVRITDYFRKFSKDGRVIQ
jgi:hypothetical protein